jgi:S-formylglutathione hydrolase FrmB
MSLLTGWLPVSVQVVAALVVLAALAALRVRRLSRWLPVLAVVAVAVALAVRRYVAVHGLSSDPAPPLLWVWIGVTAAAVPAVVPGWRGARPRRRVLSTLAVPLSLLCVGLVLNDWVGYFPTAQEAWSQLTAGPLPDEVDAAALPALAGTGRTMTTGRVVGVDIPATSSHFGHREEYVYLPPAWFTPGHPPLPVLMMISGEFNTPADWIRVGDAVRTEDGYAASHQGTAPALVFVDTGGSFNNDTECVDGPRGDVADYLTRDVPGYLESRFGVASAPDRWGVVGWSSGGTCAVDLAVMHPELFGTFEDIAGDLGPNVGDRATTVSTLYGGDQGAWARFDPMTVLAAHVPYADTAGWFVNSSQTGWPGRGPGQGHGRGAGHRPGGPGGAAGFGGPAHRGGAAGFGGRPDGADAPGAEAGAAATLCAAAGAKDITCTLHTLPGRHSWQFASSAFSTALPWLASRLGLPAPAGPRTG